MYVQSTDGMYLLSGVLISLFFGVGLGWVEERKEGTVLCISM